MITATTQGFLNTIDHELLELAFLEDLGWPYCDITTQTLFPEYQAKPSRAMIVSKHLQPMTVCGLPLVYAALEKLSAACAITLNKKDGDVLLPGEWLLTIDGPAQVLVMAERIMLNFLQRLSAVATLTAQFVAAVEGTSLKILDTRKTTPGFRHLQKYAVQCGGGVNHRLGLYDALMIKDTHIDLLGGVVNTLARLPDDITQHYPVIVEVRTQTELDDVLKHGTNKVTRVLLDNMTQEQMKVCVDHCAGQYPTEASGNITLGNIRIVAETGVDYASIGALTHSAGCVDLSMSCSL